MTMDAEAAEHPALSVVVPVYNEAATIERLVDELGDELLPLVESLEVIVVDDASTDETPRILERLARDRPWLDVRRPDRNAGHGPSVMRGLALARAEWVFQIDSDGQFLVADFAKLWEVRDACDLVLGVRASRNDPPHRLVLSRAVRIVTSVLAGRRVRDVNTPFRLLRRSVFHDLQAVLEPETLAPNILIALGAHVRGWRVVDVPVTHLAREGGVSTLREFRLVKFSLRGLLQLVAFRYGLARAPARVADEPVTSGG